MKQRILSLLLALVLLLAGCGSAPGDSDQHSRTVVATTYPVYLLTSALTQGVDDLEVVRLGTGETSCLHDYTLSVNDMKKLERASAVALNGAGLEEFLEDALAASPAQVIDCSQGVALLENLSHHHDEEAEADDHGHDHGHFDPHYWMDPANMVQMANNLAAGLAALDPDHGDLYESNRAACVAALNDWNSELHALAEGLDCPGLVTFHDGFQYFAHAFDLPLLESIEEEAGSEASAREIVHISHLVQEEGLPVIFTEVSGPDATARAITRETGCGLAQLTMVMDGPEGRGDLSPYYDAMLSNINAILKGFAREVTP